MAGGLCRHRDALGRPGEGAHGWRVAGVAGFDVLLTLAAAGGVAALAKKNFWAVLLVLLLAGTFLHAAFCVPTPLTCAFLGPTPLGRRAGCGLRPSGRTPKSEPSGHGRP
jgi:hypothetical protein